MPTIGVSSTVLRRRVRDGHSIKYYVPDAVVSYIDRHRLYGG
jgi:nicotinate-nucleotide adenylyltransferase